VHGQAKEGNPMGAQDRPQTPTFVSDPWLALPEGEPIRRIGNVELPLAVDDCPYEACFGRPS
jgi:hypothetical protein